MNKQCFGFFFALFLLNGVSSAASVWQPVEGYRSTVSVEDQAMKRRLQLDAAERDRQEELAADGPITNQLGTAFAISRIPTLANSPGQFGAFFKTRVSLLNVTA